MIPEDCRSEVAEQATGGRGIAGSDLIGTGVPALDDDMAAAGEDMADHVASGEGPGVERGVTGAADEGGICRIEHDNVGTLADGEAESVTRRPVVQARLRAEAECLRAPAQHGAVDGAAGGGAWPG